MAARAQGGAPKIVMMVGNDIAHDTRVLKMGLTLADAGLDVTLLGYASSGVREERRFGNVRILRVPVAWRMRDAAAARKKERRARLDLAMDPAHRRTLDLEASLRRREAESGAGLVTQGRRGSIKARRFLARARSGADRRLRSYETRAWKAVDGVTHRTPYAAQWRRILPEIDDYELAFGPVLDQLDWDVLHAHDVHLVGVASRAVARRKAQGRPAAWVYDAHEYVRGLSIYGPRTVRRRAGYLDLESEYVRDADAVVTVTEPLADQLKRDHRLPVLPAVVMNSPMLGAADHVVERTIRDDVGLAPGVPLMVYSGGVTAVRGVDTAVEALVDLPGVHLAVVAVPHREIAAARSLHKLAVRLGVADRLHLLDPVRPDEVAAYLRTADVGLLPIHHYGSHEVALPNKVFEYLHAGIPMLVSDTRATAEFVEKHGVGAVHVAKDTASFVSAFRDIWGRQDALRARIAEDPELLTPFAWDRQERVLRDVYRGILGDDVVHEPERSTPLEGLREEPFVRNDRASVLVIGPANMAGQAWAWAKAVERDVDGVRTEVISVDRGSPILFEADEIVPAATYANDPRWAQSLEARGLEQWTHVLLEAGRPIFGLRHGRDFSGDVPVLRSVGVEVGLVLHGSEIRNPRRHAESSPWSPFADPDDDLTARLQRQWEVLHPLVTAFDGPVFVSTPDLLEDVPGAHLLPVVVDRERWSTDSPAMERDVPVVLHAPSRASIKGTDHVEAAVRPLAEAGLVEYRLLEGVAPEGMPAAIADADIVLDQFTLGSYGVMAVQALAAGRVVVGHVTDEVRAGFSGTNPIVEATPDTLREVVERLVADRDEARAAAAAGPAYVAEHHDGRRSSTILREVLGLRGE